MRRALRVVRTRAPNWSAKYTVQHRRSVKWHTLKVENVSYPRLWRGERCILVNFEYSNSNPNASLFSYRRFTVDHERGVRDEATISLWKRIPDKRLDVIDYGDHTFATIYKVNVRPRLRQ